MNELIGKTLGRYRILEQLGTGGMAVVYKAFDTRLDAHVAVKVIRVENIIPSVLERALKRFEREAKALARLTHPNIVKVTDYGEFEGRPYLVMPYLSGGTLKDRMGRQTPWRDALQTLLPIVEALGYAHSQNMVHRDVKPSNVLLTESGQLMLTDFGIAKVMDLEETQDLTGTNAAVGTPEYMAPEQATARTADHRADIYALGIVLYEMVTGQKPYTADTPLGVIFKHASQPLPRPRQFVPGLPGGVEKILQKALEKNPKDRYQNMDEMKRAFEKALGEKTSRSFVREKAERGTLPQATEPRKEAKPSVRSSLPARNRPPIKFSRRGAGILTGVVVVVLAVWLGWPLMGKLFVSSPVPTTPALSEIQSTPTAIKRIPSATIQASLTPATTFTPTLSPPTQTPLPEGVLFFDDFESVQQNYVFYPSGDALQASIREWIPDGDHGNVLRVKPKEYGNIKFGEYSWTNYSLEFDFQMSGTLDNANEENWFAIIMRASSGNNYDQYVSFVQLFTKRLIHAYQSCPTYCLPIASIEGTSMPIRPDRWYHFKIEVTNNSMLTYVDDNFILLSWDNRIKSGKPGLDFTRGTDMTYYFDNIRVEELK